ncbi:MAG: hypothetical protein AAGF33_00565 [Pseudomonadota bacterium]
MLSRSGLFLSAFVILFGCQTLTDIDTSVDGIGPIVDVTVYGTGRYADRAITYNNLDPFPPCFIIPSDELYYAVRARDESGIRFFRMNFGQPRELDANFIISVYPEVSISGPGSYFIRWPTPERDLPRDVFDPHMVGVTDNVLISILDNEEGRLNTSTLVGFGVEQNIRDTMEFPSLSVSPRIDFTDFDNDTTIIRGPTMYRSRADAESRTRSECLEFPNALEPRD